VCTFTEAFDIILLVTKAYDTRWSCQLIEPYMKASGLVAGVQNGMTTDTIAEVVGSERTIGCVIEISSIESDSLGGRGALAVPGGITALSTSPKRRTAREQ